MGKLVVTEFVTLDGVMEDPGGAEQTPQGGWAFRYDRGTEGDRFKLDELRASDAQLLGRVTYEGFAAAWPAMNEDEFGTKMNEMPKFVVSRTLSEPAWNNTTVLGGDLAESVLDIRERFAGDVLVAGSGTLVRSLLALDLVDELHLMVYPVVLGAGRRLFADASEPVGFDLARIRQSGSVAILELERAR